MRISLDNARQIAAELSAVTGKGINIIEPDGRIIASTDKSRINKIHEGARRLVMEKLQKLTVYDSDSIGGAREGINLPIVIEGETVGVIGITGKTEEVSPLGDVIKKMTEIMLENVRRQEQTTAMENARNVFAQRWLYAEDGELNDLPSGAAVLGLELSRPRVIASLEVRKNTVSDEKLLADATGYIKRAVAKMSDAVHLQIHGRNIIIMQAEDNGRIRAEMEELIRNIKIHSGLGMCCGISSVSASEQEIRRCYAEAKSASGVAQKLRNRSIVMYNEYFPELILESIPAQIQSSVRAQVFSDCSREETRLFSETIRKYFELDGSIEKMADSEFVHKNTIYYRLEQLRKKTGLDIKNPGNTLILYVAAGTTQE